MNTVAVDGAMGTTLQADGLPRGTPADDWVRGRPETVARTHRRFVEAGAQVIRTATLTSRSVDDSGLLQEAVALARRADPREVWLSLGPVGPGRAATLGLSGALDAGADRVLLETFVDPTELRCAIAFLADRGANVVASLVPGPDGLLANLPYPTRQLREAGAQVLGLNCGTDPDQARRAWHAFHDDGAWFVAPAGGPGLEAVWADLHGRVAFLGGCCGVDPDQWRAAWPA